ncbi:putative cyclin-dependent kinase 2 [Cadophora sp. MPI-SDFR-AT-0126]|nr:putative cyclin-dependent kinase 2 [Leotiomycetes sp. MPI-SDFR-AT-0126]
MDSLRLQLKRRIDGERYEWPPGENKWFIPRSTINALIDESSIKEILKRGFNDKSAKDVHRYTTEIVSSSKRLFIIFLCTPFMETTVLEELLEEGICDKHLPFSRVKKPESSDRNSYKLGKIGHNKCRKADHGGCIIKSLSSFDQADIRDLDENQWPVLAPTFQLASSGVSHYDFPRAIILPYTEDFEEEMSNSGGFGEVWKVRIHPAHQELVDSSDPKGPLVAIKRLFPNGDYENTFRLEVEMHSGLNAHGHKHIVKLLATYKLRDKYHLIFPSAFGNLRDHWRSGVMSPWNQSTSSWVLEQIVGLVSALELIHRETGRPPIEPDVPNSGTSSRRLFRGIKLRVEPKEAQFGRHGDIKPENILWMRDSSEASGILVIADMGLGRFHRKESKSRVDPKTISGSHTYAPPEVALNKPVSRAYDVWSLGCVFLEFITWLLKGSQGLDTFGSIRMEKAEDGVFDDTFYSIKTSGSQKLAEVRPGVTRWIKGLKEDVRCSELLNELLIVVELKMLCVDAEFRISAQSLNSKLKSMIGTTN